MQLYIYQPGSRYLQNTATRRPDGVVTADFTNGQAVEIYIEQQNARRPEGSPRFQLMTWDEVEPHLMAEENQHIQPWQEITDQMWDDALNSLPPEKWETIQGVNMFRMSEYLTSNITKHYARLSGRYFMAARRTSTPYTELAAEVAAKIAEGEAMRAAAKLTAHRYDLASLTAEERAALVAQPEVTA